MLFRVRGKLPTGQIIIAKPDAPDAFAAATAAGRMFAEAGHVLAQITNVAVKEKGVSKTSVYVGKVPTGRKKSNKATDAAPAAAAAAAPTPAKPAPVAGKPQQSAAPARK